MQVSPQSGDDPVPADSSEVVTEEAITSEDVRLPDEPQAPAPAPEPEKAPASAEQAATTDDDAKRGEKAPGRTVDRRIDRLTRKLRDSEREAAYERGRRETLEQMLGRQTPAATAPTDTRPKPDDFDSTEEFADALADWKLRERQATRSDQPASEEPKAPQATPREPAQPGDGPSEVQVRSYQAAKAKFPDLDDVLTDASLPFTKAMADAVADDEDSAEVLYQLGQDPDEVERIAKLSPRQQAREVWRFAEKYRAGQPTPAVTPPQADTEGDGDGEEPRATEQPRAQVSRASPPPPPLSGTGSPSRSLADMTQDEYERTMNERERRARR